MKKFLVSYRLKDQQTAGKLIYVRGGYHDTLAAALDTASIFVERSFKNGDEIIISYFEKEDDADEKRKDKKCP